MIAEVGFAETTLVQVIKVLVIFAFVLAVTPIVLLVERKFMGRMQSRYGPNRVGPYGLLQPLADVVKLLYKEHSEPGTAVPWMMALAPMISVLTADATLALVPFGETGEDGIFGADYGL